MAQLNIDQIQGGREIMQSTYNLIDSMINTNVYNIAQMVINNLRFCNIEYLMGTKKIYRRTIDNDANGFLYILYNKDKIYHVGATKDNIYNRCFYSHKNQDWFENVTDVAYYYSPCFMNNEKMLDIVKYSILEHYEYLKKILKIGECNEK